MDRLRFARVALALSIASTSVHYSHNFVAAEDYPPVPIFESAAAYQIGIAVFWPTATVLALWAYRQLARGNTRVAGVAFAAYSGLGISTIGHFIGGVPDIPPVFFATIFTDFFTGLSMLYLAIWCVRSPAARPIKSTSGSPA